MNAELTELVDTGGGSAWRSMLTISAVLVAWVVVGACWLVTIAAQPSRSAAVGVGVVMILGTVCLLAIIARAARSRVVRPLQSLARQIAHDRDEELRRKEAVEQSSMLAIQLLSELSNDVGLQVSGWGMASALRAAEGYVAGDCSHVGLTSSTVIEVFVIDIAGHGAMAAITALKAKELLKVGLRSGLDPGDVLHWLWTQDHGMHDTFMTAFIATIDTESGLCRYANAGHPPALMICGGTIVELGGTGPLFGPFDGAWATHEVQLDHGATLFTYTDGLIETRDRSRSFFGIDRVKTLLQASNGSVSELVADVFAELDTFHSNRRLRDDVTVLAVNRRLEHA